MEELSEGVTSERFEEVVVSTSLILLMFTTRLRWEKRCSEAKDVVVTLAIYGDDTTILRKAREWNEGVMVVKREMGRWEERSNDDKEEGLHFGTREGEKIRI